MSTNKIDFNTEILAYIQNGVPITYFSSLEFQVRGKKLSGKNRKDFKIMYFPENHCFCSCWNFILAF